MRDHHALGRAGGTGGVDHIGEVIGVAAGLWIGSGARPQGQGGIIQAKSLRGMLGQILEQMGLGEQEGSLEVDGVDLVELSFGGLGDAGVQRIAGVVHQEVELLPPPGSLQLGRHSLRKRVERRAVGDIQREQATRGALHPLFHSAEAYLRVWQRVVAHR